MRNANDDPADPKPSPDPDPNTRVTCELPDGSLVDTTYSHCINVLGGTIYGKSGTSPPT